MAEPPGLIEARELTKRFGDKVAVDHLSFNVEPGRVTGFLGPNGAGKSTTMRLITGLDRADGGTATIGGLSYAQLNKPLTVVGALLEARSIHPGRSARNHLLYLAQTQDLPAKRADEVLNLVGLREVANKRAGGFSLGMTQRLGIAAAMLGNPPVLMLDEPVNGLDPEGIRWVRTFMRQLASEGPHDLRVQPPDERDGGHRRPSHRDRPGRADRGLLDRGVHRAQFGAVGAGQVARR